MKRLLVLFGILISTVCYADTETTNWYVNGELYDTTSCQSGGNINVPTAPSKRGYTFQGWEPAIYDISTLDPTINGTSDSASGNKWRVIFSYGAVYGESLCSSTSSNEWYTNTNLNTENGSGTHCYCRVTEFIPTGSNTIYEAKNPVWKFAYTYPMNCTTDCPSYCSGRVRIYDPNLRKSLYETN